MVSSLESLTDEQVRLLRVVSRNRRLRAVLGGEPRYFLVDSASGGRAAYESATAGGSTAT